MNDQTWATVRHLAVVPVAVIDRAANAVPLAEALARGGLPCVEITFRTDAAADAISAIAETVPEVLVGAGTVLTVEQAEAAVAAGARFVVSPIFDDAVVDWCLEREVPVAPGVMSPTEVGRAWSRGLRLVKFFPAEAAGGVRALSAIDAAFPGMEFMPTGGIGPENLAGYLQMQAVAACGGTWLAGRELIASGEFEKIERLAGAAVAIVRRVRSER